MYNKYDKYACAFTHYTHATASLSIRLTALHFTAMQYVYVVLVFVCRCECANCATQSQRKIAGCDRDKKNYSSSFISNNSNSCSLII